jgi:DNA repair protein RecO (recombination protein O)
VSLRFSTKAIVIKETNAGESNKIFTVYTEDFGKIKVIGKSIRKITSKLRSGLGLFSLSEISFIEGKKQKTLVESKIIRSFPDKNDELSAVVFAHQTAAAIDKLFLKEEKDESSWKLIEETFLFLSKESLRGKRFLFYFGFFWKLMKILGYQQDWKRCSSCRKELVFENAFFFSKSEKALCFSCYRQNKSKISEKPVEISRETGKLLEWLGKKELSEVGDEEISQKTKDELKQILMGLVFNTFIKIGNNS